MPKLSRNAEGGVIRWDGDDWLKGLIPNFTTDIAAPARALINGEGFASTVAIDPYRSIGNLIPGLTPTDVGNITVADNTLMAGVVDGTTGYLVGGNKNHTLTLTGTPTLTSPAPNTITASGTHSTHNTISVEDIVVYTANVGTTPTKCRFYSWIDNTDGDIGRETGGSYSNNFLSATATGGSSSGATNSTKPLIIGDDDCLYFGNGNNLGQYDGLNGTNGTVTYNKFVLPADYTITCFAKLPLFLVIFASKQTTANSQFRGESTAFFWDYASADATYKYNVQCNYFNAAFQYGSTIGCFGTGLASSMVPGQANKIFIYENNEFKEVKVFPTGAPIRGGVEVIDRVIYWADSGKVFQYGSPYPGGTASLNCITKGGSNSTGLFRNFNGANFFLSSGSGTGAGLQYFSNGFNLASTFVTPNFSPSFPEDFKGKIRKVRVQWGNVASGGNAFQLQINTNKGANQNIVFQGKTTITATNIVENYFQDANNIELGRLFFDSIALEGSYSSGSSTTATPPYLQSVEVYYSHIKI